MDEKLALDGKTILVTGASSGIGLEAARQLAAKGAQVLMVCRDPARGAWAQQKAAEVATGRTPDLYLAELSSQRSIHALAESVLARHPRIDVLIHNAGAVFGQRELSVDGIEKTFAVNHLAPFLLTHLLLDLVMAARGSRILVVSSEIHSGTLQFDNLQGERHYHFLEAYYNSKLANILFAYELGRRLAHTDVSVNSMSPGPTATRFGDNMHGLPRLFPLMMKRIPFLFAPPAQGARTLVYLASAPEVAGVSGRFFMHMHEMRTKPISYDLQVAQRLWNVSRELTGSLGQPDSAYRQPVGWKLRTDLGQHP